jgi:gamma-glutamyltranspeptidase/glutathione hydrolase
MKQPYLKIFTTSFFLLLFSCTNRSSDDPNKSGSISIQDPGIGTSGMVTSANKYASLAGLEILKNGGNAIDAAVAVGFVLAVTYPQAGNIGGGGFMVLRTANGNITSIDYREKAPHGASKDMFLDKNGNFLPEKSQVGYLSAGVPGSVAGLLYALEKFGTMKREDVMNQAIDLAENGFIVEDHFAASLNSNKNSFRKFSSTLKIFTKQKGTFAAGELFIQKDLAKTLRLIRDNGKEGFYRGETADLIEKDMNINGGLITKEDLEQYEVIERKPVMTSYKGFEIISMPPPSSGGIALIGLLNMIENDPVPDTTDNIALADYYSILIESMKRVYADRSEYLGDPDFYNVPIEKLTNKEYAKQRRNEIVSVQPSSEIKPGHIEIKESEQTTHYSVIDKDGNMISVTTTLNNTYGSLAVVEDAGFLLNDEMDDFASKPGVPNMFGLIGSKANSIEPGKRMLSSMTPTIVLKDGKPFLITGSPGGGRIITTVFRSIINLIDFNLPFSYSIDKPRFHHQWLPDKIQMENGALSDDIKNILYSKGYSIEIIGDFGRIDGIFIDWNKKQYIGHSDRRGNGLAIGY